MVGFKEYASGFFWTFFGLQVHFKNSVYIIVFYFFGLFWTILKPNQQLYVIGLTNFVFLALFFTIHLNLLIC